MNSNVNTSGRARARVGRVGVVLGAALAMCAPVVVVGPYESAVGSVSAAAAEECEPIGETTLNGGCEVALEPTPLPQRRLVGEYEIGLLTRDGSPRSSLAEFAAGGIEGSCDPATEACSTTDELGLLDDPRDPDASMPRVSVPEDTFGDPDGDSATSAVDLDGDGRQEVVQASRCTTTPDLCLSLFTPGDRTPGSAGYREPQSTGLRTDPSSIGRIRLASGPIALASATVTGARFAVDEAQETTTATFTTTGRHGFGVGDPVRLGNDPSLQETMCVDSPLSTSGVQCLGEDLLTYRPITAVTPTSFSVDLGVLVVAARGVGHPVVPDAWRAACAACGVSAESISSGVVVAWTGPTMTLNVATFAAAPGASRPFRLLDTRALGKLHDGQDASTREAIAVAVDDFRSGGADEIAVAWAGTCAEAACPRLSFLAMDDGRRLGLESTPDWGTAEGCVGEDEPVALSGGAPTSISLASGHFRSGRATTDGADLAIGWASASDTGVDHLLQTFDVTDDLTLAATRPLDASAADADSPHCATLLSRDESGGVEAQRSQVEIAAADLDGTEGDELVVAQTHPVADSASSDADVAPISVGLWSQGEDGGDGPGWRPQSRWQAPVEGWTQPIDSSGPDTTVPTGYRAVGGGGAGQISIETGRIARRQTDATQEAAWPQAINPDVLVAWTCRGTMTCGDPRSSADTAVAVDALAVAVGEAGALSFERGSTRTASVRPADVPPPGGYDAGASDRTFVQLATADLDGDSSTLGDPVRSYAVGEVQPMMVMRAPPVEFLAADGSHPAYDTDGWISSAEIYDLSSCYAANGADTDNGECPMRTTYTTEGGSETSLAVAVQSTWGLDTALKGGLASGAHDDGGDCMDPVCWETTLELAYAHREEQQTEDQRTRTFRYTTEQVAAPMQDRAFVATSDIEVNQVPVYYGTFSGGTLPAEPDLWTYSATPLDTVFSWISVNDPQYGSVFAGPTPGNVLSYPATGSQVETHRQSVASIRREGANRLAVTTTSNHGYLCALQGGQVTTAFPSPVDAQCAGQQEPVRIRGAGSFDGTGYVVSAVRSPTEILLQRIGSQVPVASDPCDEGECTISRQPSALPVQTQEVGPGSGGSTSFTFGQVDGYEERYAVSNGASAELATSGEVAGDISVLWEAHVKGEFEQNNQSMLSMVLESATTWSFEYGSASRPGSYRVTPFLADDPKSGALALTWTASPVGASGLWGNPVFGYGAVGDPDLPARPDAAFSLPLLLEPYRTHTGLDDNLDVILSSPDFATWTCAEDGVCRPPDALPVGQPLQINATVHNYALNPLPASVSRPLVVRFYLGDPARGGYVIAESKVTQTIESREDALVSARWTPPANFAGQPGQPIYAVIDPNDTFEEVFDWESPVVLTDRSLAGAVTSALSRTVDGESVSVVRTAVDHGLSVGDPVTVRGVPGYRASDEQVLAVTPTTFTVASSGHRKPSSRKGRWVSNQEESCSSNNPWYGNSTLDYYTFGDAEEFQSRCPTTNNQAYFLTPRIEGNRGAVPRSTLNVRDSGVRVTKDRRAVAIDVRSGTRLLGERIEARVWICTSPHRSCSPQLAGSSGGYQRRLTLSVGAGGSRTVRVPLERTRLKKGRHYRIAVQIVPVTTWERPPGPGLHAAAMGGLADNQTIAWVRVR
ncbi:hypothetical protein FXB39_03515 [Nocardioides sp. BGMRC 2183]|nr:hypothetical protein FXB39_03515 [Nocardioides sp. BGMRC 2183]